MLKALWRAAADRIAIRIADRLQILQLQAHKPAAPSTGSYLLPSNFISLHLRDELGHHFVIARSEPPSAYERGLMDGEDWGTSSVRRVLRRLLADGATLIDVGANIGCVSLPLAKSGSRVIAVEMLPMNCVKLHLGRLANQVSNLHIVQSAASSQDGLLQYGGEHAWGTVGHGIQTSVSLKLDTIFDAAQIGMKIEDRLVIKLDVEGHEYDVLMGAQRLIAERRPCVIFESIEYIASDADQVAKKCKQFLSDQGYSLYMIFDTILVPRTTMDLQEPLDADFLAVPSEQIDALGRFEIRALTREEQVAIVARNSIMPTPVHRHHAASAIGRLACTDAALAVALRPILEALETDGDPEVAAMARERLKHYPDQPALT